ncbi:HAD-IA family hydrolase [Candidatus Bathyarchaeota archaeon]|nr:HAD-IA family hydrolase [Candidatus Bathyarchaeota archaeon]
MSMFRGIRLVIYDLDGVLIDSNKAILESFRRTFNEVGEPFYPDLILSRIGVSLPQIFMDTLPEKYHGRIEELRQTYIRHFQSLDRSFIKLLPDVTETLTKVKDRDFRQSLATNKTVTEAERILNELGVLNYFDLLTGFLSVARPKPEPDMILYLLDKLGVEPWEAVFVDDTTWGLTAGIRAGVHTVGITTGNNNLGQIESVEPDTVIHRLSDLPDIIE